MDSQFLTQDFLQLISFLQTTQILLGKKLLLPLKEAFISSPRDHPGDLGGDLHAPQWTFDSHR